LRVAYTWRPDFITQPNVTTMPIKDVPVSAGTECRRPCTSRT
jgi:hypothetical protein